MSNPLPLASRRALFVSWIAHHARSEALASALGAECVFVSVGTLRNRRTTAFRHAWQGLVTVALLVRRRPEVLIVMAPPFPLVLLALVWRRLSGCLVIADCHSGAVVGRPMSARLAERADLVIVTLPQLTKGFPRAVAVHDPLAAISPGAAHDTVLFPASWEKDEPVDALLEAARLLPDISFAITGRAPEGLVPPGNVRLAGFLSRADYLSLLTGAPLVLALTTEEDTMQQAGYEAAAAGRPVVASDTKALRSYFRDAAVYAAPTGPSLADAVKEGLRRATELEAAMRDLRREEQAAFDAAVAEIGDRVAELRP